MPKKNDAWGIEIGSNAIKAVRLVREGEKVRLADYDILPFKKVLVGPDANADDAVQVNLDQLLSKHDLAKSTVVVSVPGNMAFARFAKLPPVEPKKIPDIVKFEAVQQIPFPIAQVSWDYQVFQQEDSPDVEVGIFAITRERVLQFLNNYRTVGLEVHGVTLSPLAVYNAMAYDMELTDKSPGVILLDIGTVSTDVIIVEKGRIWLRTLPIGGNNFTDAVVKAFKLSFPKAEKLKREANSSKYARQIFQAIRPVFADLVQELQRSLGFYQSLNRDSDLNKIVGVGSTFRLPGLIKFLKQQLQMEVIKLDNFQRISVDGSQTAEFSDAALNLATAYGLALQGVELERVSANILPRHITTQRIWRAKQPWFGAAAAVLLAATGGAFAKLWSDRSTYESRAAQSKAKIEKVRQTAEKYIQDWKKVEGGIDPRLRIENLRRILDYRDIWPKLMHDLSLAVLAFDPQPPLVSGDFKLIGEIPRERRNQVVIKNITAQYAIRLVGNEANAQTIGSKTSRGYDEIWGARGAAPAADPNKPAGSTPEAAPAGSSRFNIRRARHGATPGVTPGPEFIITIDGYTPHGDGPRQIDEKLIGWLNQHAKQKNRPYLLVATSDSLITIKQVGAGGGPAAPGAAQPAAPKPAARPAPTQPGAGVAAPRPGGVAAASASERLQAVAAGLTADANGLFPVRPLADEPREGDWTFKIEFRVRLLRPEEARAAEDWTEALAAETPAAAPAATPAAGPAAAPAPAPATPAKENAN